MFLRKGSFELNFRWNYFNRKNDLNPVENKLNMLNKPVLHGEQHRMIEKETEETKLVRGTRSTP